LIIHGINEEENECTNSLAKKFFKEKLQIDVSNFDIDRSHQLTKKPTSMRDFQSRGGAKLVR